MKRTIFIALWLLPVFGMAQQFEWAKAYRGDWNQTVIAVEADNFGNVIVLSTFSLWVDADPSTDSLMFYTNSGLGAYVSKLNAFGELVWAKQIGGEEDYIEGAALTIDSVGSVYLGGAFYDTVDFDPGPDVFNLTSDGYFMPGGGWGPPPQWFTDIYLMKLDSNGGFGWAKLLDGTSGYDKVSDLTIGNTGELIVTGTAYDTLHFNTATGVYGVFPLSYYEGFVAAFDSEDGDFMWNRILGGFSDQNTEFHSVDLGDVTTDTDGNLYLIGAWSGRADFDPGPDSSYHTPVSYWDAFVLSLSSEGDFRWFSPLEGTGTEAVRTIVFNPQEYLIYVGGGYRATVDFDPGPDSVLYQPNQSSYNDAFILCLDASGNYQWVKTFGGDRFDYVMSAVVDTFGNLFVGGYLSREVDLDPGPDSTIVNGPSSGSDMFISRFNYQGEFIWGDLIPNTQLPDNCSALSTNGNGDLFVGGLFENSTDFDLGIDTFQLQPEDYPDVFVKKLARCAIQLPDITVASCDPYTSPSGNQVWITSGTYDDALYTGYGCDTSVTVELTYYGIEPTIWLDIDNLLLASSESGENYQWIDCGSSAPIANATDSVFPLNENGTFAVIVYQNGCADTSGCLTITGLSITDERFGKLTLYPNPTTSTIRIQLPDNNLNANRTSLYDMSGRLVHQQPFNPNMDMGYLNSGTYIVVVETDEGNFRGTVVKE